MSLQYIPHYTPAWPLKLYNSYHGIAACLIILLIILCVLPAWMPEKFPAWAKPAGIGLLVFVFSFRNTPVAIAVFIENILRYRAEEKTIEPDICWWIPRLAVVKFSEPWPTSNDHKRDLFYSAFHVLLAAGANIVVIKYLGRL